MRHRLTLKPWMFAAAIWIGPAVLACLSAIGQRRLEGEPAPTLSQLLFQGGDWLIYGILTPIIFWVSNRWPIAKPHVARRVAIHVGVSLLLSAAWATSGKLFQLILTALFERAEFDKAMQASTSTLLHTAGVNVLGWLYVTLPFGMVVYICVMGMAHAIRYFVEAREREVQIARMSEQLAGARFAALEAHLNPHFLFNTLNTIAVRARDGDGRGTAQMVEQLSELLRRTLSRHQSSEVNFEEELELVRQYLAIEEARYSDRLNVEIAVDRSLFGAAVPSFAVQHLAENAIRHGISQKPGAGQLTISARRDVDALEIVVADDGAGFDASVDAPTGHGIANTRERLQALYAGNGSLVITSHAGGPTTATLRIPYRNYTRSVDE